MHQVAVIQAFVLEEEICAVQRKNQFFGVHTNGK